MSCFQNNPFCPQISKVNYNYNYYYSHSTIIINNKNGKLSINKIQGDIEEVAHIFYTVLLSTIILDLVSDYMYILFYKGWFSNFQQKNRNLQNQWKYKGEWPYWDASITTHNKDNHREWEFNQQTSESGHKTYSGKTSTGRNEKE